MLIKLGGAILILSVVILTFTAVATIAVNMKAMDHYTTVEETQ